MKISKFNIILIATLLLLFVFMLYKDNSSVPEIKDKPDTVIIFTQPMCSACKKQKQYINEVLRKKHPELKFEFHDLTEQKEYDLLQGYFKKYSISQEQLATPMTFFRGKYLIGFQSPQELENLLQNKNTQQAERPPPEYINTWFGKINIIEKSLPALAIILGLVDGFNPCAMWVLVYMISLIAGLNDKRKIWLIVGTFVFASAVLYYLFMTALLNVFLYVGYIRILQLMIGVFAIYVGINSLKSWNKLDCEVTTGEAKQKTRNRVKRLVEAEISILTIFGIILLAFVVNSMEFVCSAALPAIFTSVLAQAKLSMVVYHAYILLYVFFFMLNELIIFITAAFAVDYYAGEGFMPYVRLIGGVVILGLGLFLVFAQ